MVISAKRKIILWAAVILIAIFFGLETTHTDCQDPLGDSIDLSIYGKYVGSDIANPPHPPLGVFAYLGNYRTYLIATTFIISFTLFIRLRKKGK